MGYGSTFGQKPEIPKPPIDLVFEHYYEEVDLSRGPGWDSCWQKILCPLHVEERPSASINIGANRWKCHACDISEDSLDIIMREEGIGFNEAIEQAGTWFGGECKVLPESVQRKYSRGVPDRPRFGRGRGEVSPGVRRRFGDGGS